MIWVRRDSGVGRGGGRPVEIEEVVVVGSGKVCDEDIDGEGVGGVLEILRGVNGCGGVEDGDEEESEN